MQTLAIQYLSETRERFPDKTAIVHRNRSIGFGELWRQSVELGYRLHRSLATTHLPVVIDISKSIEAIIALLGIQLSGNIYVPLDVESPPERRRKMLDSLGDHEVLSLAEDGGFRLARHPLPANVGTHSEIEQTLLAVLESRQILDPLYVIFTSGSTGTPKGVTVANGSVIDYIDWARRIYDVSDAEIIANQAPLYFDNSVLDLYLTLACGCTLHLLDRQHFMFLPELMAYLRDNGVNLVFFVPSLLANICALKLFDDYPQPQLKKLLFAGEPMPPGVLEHLRDKLPDALLSNLYGPTEITVDAIYWMAPRDLRDMEKVPLGKPCENSRIIFLDENQNPVDADDVQGEICVAGIGVALGYWNDPDRSGQVFIQNPQHHDYREIIYRTGDLGYRSSADGLIYMTGRRDDQIKHMGYRIEPGEVESALHQIPGIVQASVLFDRDRSEILAFYATGDRQELSSLRRRLSRLLPAYMIPKRLMLLEQLPLTPNGKVDKPQLWNHYQKSSAAGDLRD